MNDVYGVIFYAALFALWAALITLDQWYRVSPRDPKRKPLDVSEQETAKMPRVREPVAR